MTPVQITHTNPPSWTAVEYSTMSPFNSDNTRLLLIRQDHFGLYDGDGNFLKDLPIGASSEPRWSRKDPSLLYYVRNNQLFSLETSKGQITDLHTFTEYIETNAQGQFGIWAQGESEISLDGNHLVLRGITHDLIEEVFVYRISTDTKSLSFVQTEPFDGLKIDGKNRPVLSKDSGIYVLDSTVRRIAPQNGHAHLTRSKGKDILLWCSSNDGALNKNAVVMIDVDTSAQTILAVFDWNYAFHISAPVNQEWCIVSTIDSLKKTLPSQVWKIYFDPSIPAELVCDTGSVFVGYNSTIKASISRDGTRIVGCSNFGKTSDPNYCDVFMVKLNSPTPPTPSTTSGTDMRIDYSPYAGKSVFIMVPRPDGAVDIFERKL